MAEPDTHSRPAPADTGAYQPLDSAADLVRVLDQYLADLQAGQPPDRGQVLAAHPQLAAQLEQCLAGIDFIHRTAQPNAPARLGEFRILRELGRGGMGVVYEAEQLSLKRRVALKVLRFGGLADADALQRFQREAETVAGLHHTNIVPIHAVGCENGVHYYAMQFIEGQSLAVLLPTPRAANEVAHWGLQAAEALTYAHQRGVIHRDVKPSNLLLDAQGIVWLTDFGLARRADEVALTVTGVLLGTPRYMSPEQAAALKQPVDQRSDIYSLGATLYELVTGQPVFDADTPQGVLLQILNAEPTPPRQVRPQLPRDLETIILKCLAKEPGRRYASAQALADDLRAFGDGRAIQARRPSLVERGGRWVRQQRRSVSLAAAAAAIAAVVMVLSFLTWNWYAEWRLGRFVVTTEGPALEAEVLDQNDEPVLPSFTVPTRQPIALPGGQYRLRLAGPGRLSETYQLLVEQGQQLSFDIGPSDRPLWPPIAVTKGCELVELDGRADAILVTDQGLTRIDGRTGKPIWQRSLDKGDQAALAAQKDFDWAKLQRESWVGASTLDAPHGAHPELVRPLPDLEGAGRPCLVWASSPFNRGDAWVLAVDATDGTVKWWFRGGESQIVCPLIVADADGDGLPDIIAIFDSPRSPETGTTVEAISGRTGRSLWRFVFAAEKRQPPLTDDEDQIRRHCAATVRQSGNRDLLYVTAGRQFGELDLRTGKAIRPIQDLGLAPVARPIFGDLVGDGQLSLLLHSGKRSTDFTLTAFSPTSGILWEHRIGATGRTSNWPMPATEWPVVQDLGGDGKQEVIVPYHNGREPWWQGWVGLAVLDGQTGQSRWQCRLSRAYGGSAESHGVAHILVGPDLDGDGQADIFTAALLEGVTFDAAQAQVRWLLASAVSGKDGRILWRHLRPLGADPRLSALRWGPLGPDGWPCLLVPVVNWEIDWKTRCGDEAVYGIRSSNKLSIQPQTFLLAAATGKLAQTWPGIFEARSADPNGDGLPDLLGLQLEPTGLSGKVHGLRGGLEIERRLGTWQPAIKGRTPGEGRTLGVSSRFSDLDGDGISDMVVFHPNHWTDSASLPPLQAFSGMDGRRLWKVDAALGTQHPNRLASKCSHLECRDLNGDGRPEAVIVYRLGQEGSANQGWLAVLDGRNGSVLWKEQLGGFEFPAPGGGSGSTPGGAEQSPVLFDCNGDGMLDILIRVEAGPNRPELRALDGRGGRLLWSRPLSGRVVQILAAAGAVVVQSTHEKWDPPLDDRHGHQLSESRARVDLLDAHNGQERWSWTGPNNAGRAAVVAFADLDGEGRRSVCVWHTPDGPKIVRDGFLITQVTPQLIVFDDQGQPRQQFDFPPTDSEKCPALARSADLDGDGMEELLLIGNGKVQALKNPRDARSAAEALLWEWTMPALVGDILDVKPASFVAVRSAGVVHGLDSRSGRLRWRCDGPGRPAALRDTADEPPVVLFHNAQPESTAWRKALPTGESGRYEPGTPAPLDYGSAPADPWEVVPLPWEGPAKQRLSQAMLPSLACLGLVVIFAWKRQWRIVAVLAALLLAVPLIAGALELWQAENRPAAGQQFDCGGWYWLWPYVLSAPGSASVGVALLALSMAILFWLPSRLRLTGIGLLVCLLATWFMLSPGPSKGSPWWETPIPVPGGLTWKSPLAWMFAGLAWLGARWAFRKT